MPFSGAWYHLVGPSSPFLDEDYAKELEAIEELFTPLVLKCKELGRAMRIGTNHGSLSRRRRLEGEAKYECWLS